MCLMGEHSGEAGEKELGCDIGKEMALVEVPLVRCIAGAPGLPRIVSSVVEVVSGRSRL